MSTKLFLVTLLSIGCAGPRSENGAAAAQALVDGWTKAVNSGNGLAAIDSFIAVDYVWHLPGDNVRGRAAVRAAFADLFKKCPQFRTQAEQVVTDGKYVVVRWTEFCSPGVPSGTDITMDRFGGGQFREGWEVASEKAWVP